VEEEDVGETWCRVGEEGARLGGGSDLTSDDLGWLRVAERKLRLGRLAWSRRWRANRPEGSSRANNKAAAACAVLSVEMEREEMSALCVQVKGVRTGVCSRLLGGEAGQRLAQRGGAAG